MKRYAYCEALVYNPDFDVVYAVKKRMFYNVGRIKWEHY
jgi:hypothetical protein